MKKMYTFANEPCLFYYGQPLDEDTLYAYAGIPLNSLNESNNELTILAEQAHINGFFSMPDGGIGSPYEIYNVLRNLAGEITAEEVEWQDYLAKQDAKEDAEELEKAAAAIRKAENDEALYYECLENKLLGY